MSNAVQLDFFAESSQGELFDENAAPVLYHADPDKVRDKLNRIMAEARAAATMPWPASRAGLYRTIVPQMVLWLPADEAAQLRLEFEQEWERLKAA